MAIFRCAKCKHIREVPNEHIGKSVKCPKCGEIAPIHETIALIQNITTKYVALYTELKRLKQQQASSTAEFVVEPVQQSELDDIDIYNTTAMTETQQYEPIITWFKQKGIQVGVDHKAIDTTGFFDEVAVKLGDEYDVLQVVSEKIKHIQKKGYTDVKLHIAKNSQKETRIITKFCQELYDYSFVVKYFYQKNEKIIRLTLQTAPSIKQFFSGEWMEWFVFMKLLELLKQKNLKFSCLRSFTITFPNEDLHELDVFFLVNGAVPICVECKSGEFRQDIEKYVKLRKRLNLDKAHFLICAIGLSNEQTQGLTSMYDLTFVNEKNFLRYLSTLSWTAPPAASASVSRKQTDGKKSPSLFFLR